MIGFYGGTGTANDTTWDGTGTASTIYPIFIYPQYIYKSNASANIYEEWERREREAETLRKYEESRNWTNAPISTRPHYPPTSQNNFRNIICHYCTSPRPWTGRNFHK